MSLLRLFIYKEVYMGNFTRYRQIARAKTMWRELADIPINAEDEIEQDYMHFPKGTVIYDIWHWMENNLDISIFKLQHNQY